MDTIQYIGLLLKTHVFGTTSADGISFPTISSVIYIAVGVWWVLCNLRWWYEFSIAKYGSHFSSMTYMDGIIQEAAKKYKYNNERVDTVKDLLDSGVFKWNNFLIMACPLHSSAVSFIILLIMSMWFLVSSLIIGSLPPLISFIVFVVAALLIPTMFIRRRFIKAQMVEEKLST